MAVYVLVMNFPLLANRQANVVPGAGYQETDFCFGASMQRIIMKCYIHTELHSGCTSVYTGKWSFLLGNKKLFPASTRGGNRAPV